MRSKTPKIIFITGGVVSSLGKGIIAASIARLFKDQKLKVNMMKCDPYLNVDSGTISPIEHGEVFVTADGGETDLDIGHYERFLGDNLKSSSSLTSGKVYLEVLRKERSGNYLGKTIQVIPHITDLIKKQIYENAKGYDVLFVEIGGTVGDIESLPFLEATRQIITNNKENSFLIHGSYIPFLETSNESKTKPTQHSVKELLSIGLQPNMIVTRNKKILTQKEKDKIAMFCNVDVKNVIESIDVDNIYKIPLILKAQKADLKISNFLKLKLKRSKHEKLNQILENIKNTKNSINIAIVGKYSELEDSYISVIEALKHAAINNKVKIKIDLINAKKEENIENKLENYDGIIIPGGFGQNGINNKLKAINYCRVNNKPMLGICLGMQLSLIEFAKNVCNINAKHQEFDSNGSDFLIHLLENQDLSKIGGSQRLGEYNCYIYKNTKAYEIYKSQNIKQRHRHRYEFNNKFKEELTKKGMVFSGINPEKDLCEIIEIPENDYFIAVQYHPEFNSKLTKPDPLFNNLVKTIITRKEVNKG